MMEYKLSKETTARLDTMSKEIYAKPSDLVELALVSYLDRYFSSHYAKYRKQEIEHAHKCKKLIEQARKKASMIAKAKKQK